MLPKYIYLSIIFFALCGLSASGSETTGFDFFASEDLLNVTLNLDTREFIRTKNDPKYMEATMTVKISDEDSITQKIRIKARGEMRRNYCRYPPIMLKFSTDENDSGRIIHDKGTLKLVTHCNASCGFGGTVQKEYLAYKLFNMVTPYSFRTRLVRITYRDINKPGKTVTAYGFLIENEDKMAERNRSVMINLQNVTQKHMFPLDMTRIAVFNYMIGNTDWSVPYQHNIKVMKSLVMLSNRAIPVAYDFDYSGFVNATYAVPQESLPIKDVTERYYLGLCDRESELNKVIDEFLGLEDKFMDTINDFEYLSKNDKIYVESYLENFFNKYSNRNYLVTDLTRTCRSF